MVVAGFACPRAQPDRATRSTIADKVTARMSLASGKLSLASELPCEGRLAGLTRSDQDHCRIAIQQSVQESV